MDTTYRNKIPTKVSTSCNGHWFLRGFKNTVEGSFISIDTKCFKKQNFSVYTNIEPHIMSFALLNFFTTLLKPLRFQFPTVVDDNILIVIFRNMLFI